jgi:hypothetical protein
VCICACVCVCVCVHGQVAIARRYCTAIHGKALAIARPWIARPWIAQLSLAWIAVQSRLARHHALPCIAQLSMREGEPAGERMNSEGGGGREGGGRGEEGGREGGGRGGGRGEKRNRRCNFI